MKLEEICQKYQGSETLRGGDKCQRHNYCEKYERHLSHLCDCSFVLLEIGVMDGLSLKAWKEYFPKAKIVGVDIKESCKQYSEENVCVEIGSQKDSDFLVKVEKKHGPFDVVIDDGSHRWVDVIVSFKTLFPLLKNGGIYVIEDLHTSYFEKYSQGGPLSPIQYLKMSIDKINMYGAYTPDYVGANARAADKQTSVNDKLLALQDCNYNIYGLSFYPSICFIEKEKNCKTLPKIL